MRVRVYMSGNYMMDFSNEEKPMCTVTGGQAGGAKMMIFQVYSLQKIPTQTNGNIVILLHSSRNISIGV